ncbi:MAG: ABC transporter substrate-binding protein [Chloroflexi bacterium]|nr:ABC transporter substrate-binding protein [Chloroflexota bacterium]
MDSLKLSAGVNLLATIALILASCANAAPPPAVQEAAGQPAGLAPKPGVPTATSKTEEPRRGGGITLALSGEPDTFDPHQSVTISLLAQISSVYNGVLRYNNTAPGHVGEIIGDLAKSWEISPDGTVFTFKLAPEVTWHDGKPLTADDIKWNFERMGKPPRGMISPRKDVFASVSSVEAPDPLAVIVRMKDPSMDFLADLAVDEMVMLPRHAVEAYGGDIKDPRRMVAGTGAFVWKGHTAGVGGQMARNPTYFRKGLPYLEWIKSVYIPDESTVLSALLTRRIDFVNIRSAWRPSHMEFLTRRGGDTIKTYNFPGLLAYRLVFNLEKPPFSDVKVRRAFSLATDRHGITKAAMEGGADISPFMPPFGSMVIPAEEAQRLPGFRVEKDADLEEARTLLKEAGYIGGKIRLTYRTPIAIYSAVVSVLQRNMAAVGIDLELVGQELAVFDTSLAKGSYDVILYVFNSPSDTPTALLSGFFKTGAGRNFNKYSNPDFDRLALAQLSETDQRKRRDLVLEMQRMLLRDLPQAVILWSKYYYATTGRIQNFNPGIGSRQMMRLDHVWVSG